MHAIASHPRGYELIQALFGLGCELRPHIAPFMRNRDKLALDLGSATGSSSAANADRAIFIDVDLGSLALLKKRRAAAWAVQGDAGALPLRDDSVDTTTCVAVSHHLSDEVFAAALREIARVTRDRLVFVDGVRNEERWLSRMLWRYDRGRNPRTKDELIRALGREFEILDDDDYTFAHEYWLALARPRSTRS